VAYTGLEKWHKELRGKANFEVAREFIKSVYKLRDEIKICRSPFISAMEFPKGYYTSHGNHTAEEKGQAMAHVYGRRWESVGKATQEFDTVSLEAEALWGISIKEKIQDFRKCVHSLNVYIQAYISNEYSDNEDFNSDQEHAKEVKNVIWDIKSEENDYTKRIDAAIEALEKEIRPHLSRS
jgi:ribosome-associated translation inhibitor RaiA